jgi:hypothetical protein
MERLSMAISPANAFCRFFPKKYPRRQHRSSQKKPAMFPSRGSRCLHIAQENRKTTLTQARRRMRLKKTTTLADDGSRDHGGLR